MIECEHILYNWNLVYQCRECGEIVPEEIAQPRDIEHASLTEKVERLEKGIKMAHLHLLASVCECGEPLKETDAFDCLDALLESEGEDDE